ncbi:MAG: PilZ domain-containing protein [Deltaproteobacteria bacterium]|nr:PilZ domain-containing protein [Deltaproteobacteria bacterium]
MTRAERRQHPRKDSLNLLSYICLDENDHELTQGMGRTLNVSESGILLETYRQIDTKHVLLLDIGLADDLIDIKGKVIYSKSLEWSTFRYGIQFLDMDKNALLTLKKFIKAFRKMKS